MIATTRLLTELKLTIGEARGIKRVAKQAGVSFTDLGEISAGVVEQFVRRVRRTSPKHAVEQLRALYNAGPKTATARYDFDHGTSDYPPFVEALKGLDARFILPNYRFWCPLLTHAGFRLIVDPSTVSESGLIVDVGCGTGQLLRSLERNLLPAKKF